MEDNVNTALAGESSEDGQQQPTEEPDRQAQPVDDEQPPHLPFPVVGIGASAGGLGAFTEFFKAMRDDSGMAFVLILHLPPEHHSMVPEILARHTKMPCAETADGMAVEPNHVYVIRPGHNLSIKKGHLHLDPPLGGSRAANRPIDDFFKTLAEEQRERAVCIVLSGMGSDGTAGAQAVKAVGGLCVAQDPESTEFPSMPQHLMDAGYADYILPPKDMPEVVLAYAGHPYAKGLREADSMTFLRREQHHMREILAVLRTRTRQDFSGYKKPTILRRVQRRMGLARLTDVGRYAKLLRQNPGEVTALADDLLIHVTGFFRDSAAWEVLRKDVIVPLIGSRNGDETIRCWVTACSSGEEAYTLAILLIEEAERVSKQLDIKVFATDMAERSLQNARAGIYPNGIETEVSAERLARFFEREDAVYRVRPEVRERVVFAPQNVLQDPPFSRLDIVSCRNLLIYLEPPMQQRILALLHFGLREGGALFLGCSETVAGADDAFEAIDKKSRIYRRMGPTRHGMLDFPPPRLQHPLRADETGLGTATPTLPRISSAVLTQRALLEHHTPAAVLIDREHRILYYHGNTRPYLEQPTGEPTRDFMSLVREGVRGAARVALQRAATEDKPVTVLDGWIETEPGRRSRLAITVSPTNDKTHPDYRVVSFSVRGELTDGPKPAAGATDGNGDGAAVDSDDATGELRRVRDELQSTIEELQTTNEELKASNEEVTSINEELQSTNEELETSKEEMQSLNEELTTVNAQLQVKMEEHLAASNDMASLLSSTEIAVVFLDRNFRIRRFTPAVRELFELIASDAGRPLSDLARKSEDPHLMADAAAVLEKLLPVEREIRAANGKSFIRRITPYRTADDRIEGVVVAFLNITENVKTATRLAEVARLLDLTNDGVIVRDVNNRITYWNRGSQEIFGWTAEEAIGKDLHSFLRTEFELPLPQLVDKLREHDRMTDEVVQYSRDGRRLTLLCRWALDRDADGNPASILTTSTEITSHKHAEEALRESDERFRLLVEGAHDFAMLMLDMDGRITAWNIGAERLLGFTEAEAVGQGGALIFTPEDRAAGQVEKELREAAQTGRAPDERWHLRKDGTRFWASGVMHARRDPAGGQLRGFVKVLRDETARKLAADALQSAKSAAEVANRMKDEFLATLSHELRTPLSSILLWTRILQSRGTLPDDQAEALDAILRSAEAQKQLIDDLMDTSRITSGKLRLDLRMVDFGTVFREAIDSVSPTAEAKGVTLSAAISPEVGLVQVDPDRMRQVIWNLLTNAIKFTPAAGRVEITLMRRGAAVEIRVTDTGRGIDPEFIPHIFEPFRQEESSTTRTFGGLGLGLAICKQLVEQHGGTITAASDGIGKGATFEIRLPLPASKRSTTRKFAAGKESQAPIDSNGLNGVKVLVVEDDADTRAAIATVLSSVGAVVTAVESAAAAMESFERERPDLIVSDIGMSGEDGYSLIRRIRALEAAAGEKPVPAAALSAFAREQDSQRALQEGFNRHIAKPIDPQKLLAVIRELARS